MYQQCISHTRVNQEDGFKIKLLILNHSKTLSVKFLSLEIHFLSFLVTWLSNWPHQKRRASEFLFSNIWRKFWKKSVRAKMFQTSHFWLAIFTSGRIFTEIGLPSRIQHSEVPFAAWPWTRVSEIWPSFIWQPCSQSPMERSILSNKWKGICFSTLSDDGVKTVGWEKFENLIFFS